MLDVGPLEEQACEDGGVLVQQLKKENFPNQCSLEAPVGHVILKVRQDHCHLVVTHAQEHDGYPVHEPGLPTRPVWVTIDESGPPRHLVQD